MNKEELYDLIERYIGNALTDAEIKDVEDRLMNDRTFAHEVMLHKEIQFTLANKDLQDFRQKLMEADKTYATTATTEPRQKSIPFYLKIAAAITLLIGISGVLFYTLQTGNPSKGNLFESYFTPYDAPVNFRSGNSPYTDENWKLALTLYDEGKYQKAIPYLDHVIKNKPENKLAQLLSGISNLIVGNTTKAEVDFTAIIQHQQNLFIEQATWYLALLYIKEGKQNDATLLLRDLDNSSYHAQAKELLLKLD